MDVHHFMIDGKHARLTRDRCHLETEVLEGGKFVSLGRCAGDVSEQWARLIFIALVTDTSPHPPGSVHNSLVIPEGWMEEMERRYAERMAS